jgi:signal transduction histidine kinase
MTIYTWSFFLIIFEKKTLKKYRVLLICFSLLLIISCKQDNVSSLNSNLFQSEVYKKSKTELKIKYLDSLEGITNRISNDSILRSFLFELSAEYYYQNNNKKSFGVCKKILCLSSTAKDTFSIAKAYSYIGDTFQISQKDSAYYYYQKSEKLYRILNNRNYVGKMLFKKAYILFFEGNYTESEIQVSNSLLYLKNSKDAEMLFAAYTLMGTNFEKLEEYKEALKYQLLAKDVLNNIYGSNSNLEKKYLHKIESAINISNIYEKTHQYQKSIQELKSVLIPGLKEKWIQGYVTIIGNLGYSKMKSGNLEGVEKLLNESLTISKSKGIYNNVAHKLLNLGEYYVKVKDSARAISYLKQSLQLAEKLKTGEETQKSLKLLSQIDKQNASIYDKRYIVISDSLAKAQRINRNKYARIEYETSVVEDENKVLSAKNTYIIIGSLLLIFILITVIVYRHIKSQKREIEFRKAQQKAEEEIFELLKEYQIKLVDAKEQEQNRISKELHDSVMNKLYGARMQLGILNDSDVKEIKEKRLIYVDLLQEIEQEIRTISHDLQSDVIDNQFDYVSLLSNLIQLQNEIGTTIFSFEIDSEIDWDVIDSIVKITIFRIVQECLLNVTKHAKAKQCIVTLTVGEELNSLKLTLKDDGIGFDVASKASGIGLKNIKDRLLPLKSEFKIFSNLDEGTSIQITFFKVQLD